MQSFAELGVSRAVVQSLASEGISEPFAVQRLVIADILAARVFPARLQYRVIVPAGLLTFVPLAGFAVSPGLGLALGLLVVSGLGSAWMAGMDGLLVATAPPALRNRALALSSAGLMFTQGAGFALWGIAGQYIPLPVVIPMSAAAGAVASVLRQSDLRSPSFEASSSTLTS